MFVTLYLGNYVYTLSAVLFHCGRSAYSGHYMAHIRDQQTEAWYKINDEETEKIAGKNLQLGNEEGIWILINVSFV